MLTRKKTGYVFYMIEEFKREEIYTWLAYVVSLNMWFVACYQVWATSHKKSENQRDGIGKWKINDR